MYDIVKLYEERYYVCAGMDSIGGSFIRGLSQALRHADMRNLLKIRAVWPEDWNFYLSVGKKLKEGKEGEELCENNLQNQD